MNNGNHYKKVLPIQRECFLGIIGLEDREVAYRKVSNIKRLKTTRRILRSKMTPAEAALWNMIKNKKLQGRKFRRQHSVGNYILDFFCPKERLAIELDGQYHEYRIEKDAVRDRYLQSLGIKVLRFENIWIWDNPDGVLKEIVENFGWYK